MLPPTRPLIQKTTVVLAMVTTGVGAWQDRLVDRRTLPEAGGRLDARRWWGQSLEATALGKAQESLPLPGAGAGGDPVCCNCTGPSSRKCAATESCCHEWAGNPVQIGDTLPRYCHKMTEPETCFGAVGPKCDKLIGLDSCPQGWQAVSVGSLVHDTCCHHCEEGTYCSSVLSADPLSWTSYMYSNRSFQDDVAKDYPCTLEWRKAVWNLLDKRSWCAPQSAEESDMALAPGNRKYDTTTYWGFLKERRTLQNVKATAGLCAPNGTSLDCLDCSVCEDCPAGIGDSDFCCSGYFVKVQSVMGKRFGTCGDGSRGASYWQGLLHFVPVLSGTMALTAAAFLKSQAEGASQVPLLST
jgi:hypothetical protein